MSNVYRRSSSIRVDIRSHHLAITASNGLCAASLWQHGHCELLIHEQAGTGANALHKLLIHPQLPREVQQVSYACLPQRSTLVPQALMSTVDPASHLQLVHGEASHGTTRSLLMDDPAAYCLFEGDRSLEERLLRHWPSATSIPLQAQCIQSALSRRGEIPLMFAHLWEQRLDLVIANEHGPLLSNSFEARTPEDVLYFVLFAAEQTELGKHYQLHHAGPSVTDEHIDLLQRYCEKVVPAIDDRPDGPDRPWAWTTLLERQLCVS